MAGVEAYKSALEHREDVPVKSLAKAVGVLHAFSESDLELGVSEISRKLGIQKSTVHNILKTFEVFEFVERNPVNQKYRLGIRLFELGNLVRRGMHMRQIAVPYMENLVKECQETIHLTVYRDGEVIYIESALPNFRVGTTPVSGRRAPLHCTGVGKAILAFLPKEAYQMVVERGLEQFTPNTITDSDLLEADLAGIRRRGYAIDDMEHEHGIRCVAAPIRNESGAVFASMSVTGPSPRFTPRRIEDHAQRLMDVTRAISERLGYRPAS